MEVKILSITAALCILCGANSAWAYDFKVDGIMYKITDHEKKTVAIVNSNPMSEPSNAPQNEEFESAKFRDFAGEYSGEILISGPVQFEGVNYDVTEIGYGAFANCPDLKYVNIYPDVSKIGAGAFWKLSSTNNIGRLPIDPENGFIGMGAFGYCNWFCEAQFFLMADVIDDYAFYGSGQDIIYLKTRKIGYKAFGGCGIYELNVLRKDNSIPVFNDSFDETDYENCIARFPEEEIEAFKAAGWNRFKKIDKILPLGIGDVEVEKRMAIEGDMLRIATGEPVAIEAFSYTGTTVASHPTASEHTLMLPQGFYIVRLTTADGHTSTIKISMK